MQVHLPSSPSKLDVNLSPTASLRWEQRSTSATLECAGAKTSPAWKWRDAAKLRSSAGFPARKLVRLSATMSMSLCLSGNWDVFWGHLCAWPLVAWSMDWGISLGHWEHHAQKLVNHKQNITLRNFCLQYVVWENMIYFIYSLEVFSSSPLKFYYIPKGRACLPTIIFRWRAVKLRGCIFTAWLSAGTEHWLFLSCSNTLMTSPRTRMFGIKGTSNVGE